MRNCDYARTISFFLVCTVLAEPLPEHMVPVPRFSWTSFSITTVTGRPTALVTAILHCMLFAHSFHWRETFDAAGLHAVGAQLLPQFLGSGSEFLPLQRLAAWASAEEFASPLRTFLTEPLPSVIVLVIIR